LITVSHHGETQPMKLTDVRILKIAIFFIIVFADYFSVIIFYTNALGGVLIVSCYSSIRLAEKKPELRGFFAL